MRLVMRWLPALLAGFLVLACRHNAPKPGEEAAGPPPPTYVEVDNQGYVDMDIYVLSGGQRVRLGTVTGISKARFKLPSYVVGGLTPVRFLADPIGGRRAPVSNEITVAPGETVTLTIPPG